MSQATRLEELRELLYERPNAATWQRLCSLFGAWPWQDDVEVGLAYAEAHLVHWPDHLRVAPQEWASALVQRREPPLGWRLVRALEVPRTSAEHVLKMIQQDHMSHITQLSLNRLHLSEQAARKLCESPTLSAVKQLSVQGYSLPSWGSLSYLSTSPLGRQIERLQLTNVVPHGALNEDDFALTAFPALKRLRINYCPQTSALLKRWQHCPAWRNLTHLNIAYNQFHSVREFAEGPFWQHLTHLDLSGNYIHRGGCNGLFELLQNKPIAHLKLNDARLNQEAFQDLSRYNAPPQLKELSLTHNLIDDRTLGMIARLPLLSNVTKLHLAGNRFGERGLGRLISSRYLPLEAKMPFLEAMSNSDLKALVHKRKLKRPNRVSRFQLMDLLLQHTD